MGIIMLGIFSMSIEGISGAIFFMVSHGLVSGGLFMLVGFIYDRTHTKEMAKFGGLAKIMPIYATIFCIMILGGIGLPLTSGFVGEFLSLLGIFKTNPWFAVLGGFGIIMGAIYSLNLYKLTFFGKITNKANLTLPDLKAFELCAIIPILVLVLVLGVFPNTLLAWINDGVLNMLSFMYDKASDETTTKFIKSANELRMIYGK